MLSAINYQEALSANRQDRGAICMVERPVPDWGATPLLFSRPIRFLIGNGRNKQKFRLATELGRGAPT
jgi:hypothetical protein